MSERQVWMRAGLAALMCMSPAAIPAQERPGYERAERAASRDAGTKGLAEGLRGVLADDAILVYPGAPVTRSRAAILAMLRAQPAAATRVSWTPVHRESSGDGSLLLVSGTTTLAPERPDSAPRTGHYLAAWRRSAAGAWKLHALCLVGAPSAGRYAASHVAGPATPPLPRDGTGPFAGADYAFSDQAGREGAGPAFEAFAAPDAVLPAGGAFRRGPRAIRETIDSSGPLLWRWWPVYSFADSALGVTVGESELRDTTAAGGGATYHTAYMTLWRRAADGTVRYIADAGGPRARR